MSPVPGGHEPPPILAALYPGYPLSGPRISERGFVSWTSHGDTFLYHIVLSITYDWFQCLIIYCVTLRVTANKSGGRQTVATASALDHALCFVTAPSMSCLASVPSSHLDSTVTSESEAYLVISDKRPYIFFF